MTQSSEFRRRQTRYIASALLLVAALATTSCMRDDLDRIVNGGQFPPGWSVRPDRGTPQQLQFTQAGDVFHFVVGPAGTFYNSEWTKSGDYTYSARMTQLKAPSHETSYGITFGGSNLDKPSQSYSYFMVRQNGEYYIANKDGASGPKSVVDWTKHAAIAKPAASGRELQTWWNQAVLGGVHLGAIQSGSRRRADGAMLEWTLTDLRCVVGDGVVPFLIDWGTSPHPSLTAPKGALLAGLRAQHPDHECVRNMLSVLALDLHVDAGLRPALIAEIRCPNGVIVLR